MSTPQRTRVPVHVPSRIALPLLVAMAICIAYAWPLLLTMKIRRGLGPGARIAVSALFGAATLGFASYLAADILPATDIRVVTRSDLGMVSLVLVPALFAWGAAAFAWAGVGALGSVVALGAAAAWGLKPVYATWASSSRFWSAENPFFYGAGMGLVAIAVLLGIAQVLTLRAAREEAPSALAAAA